MPQTSRSWIAVMLLLAALSGLTWMTYNAVTGKLDAADAILAKSVANIEEKDWLKIGATNSCEAAPCLVVQHEEGLNNQHFVRALLTDFPADGDITRTKFTLTVSFGTSDDGTIRLTAKRFPAPALHDPMLQAGVDLVRFRKEEILYQVEGAYSWRTATVDLPYGAFSQFVFDGFQKAARAMGLEPDAEILLGYAEVVTTEVNNRFAIDSIAENARVAMIVSGPTQTLTYAVAVLAILFVFLEWWRPLLKPYSDGLADLIPFTGFFGTLLGVANGLEVLGLSNVTNDVSKALSLGKIGSSLSFAINTTILAIVVFSLVIIIQYTVRATAKSTAD